MENKKTSPKARLSRKHNRLRKVYFYLISANADVAVAGLMIVDSR